MVVEKLIEEFLQSTVGQTVLSKLKSQKPEEIYFHGLTDSAKGFFLTSLISSIKKTVLYLANDASSALNLYLEILNLTTLPVFYFCAQEVSVYDQISSDVEVVSHQ